MFPNPSTLSRAASSPGDPLDGCASEFSKGGLPEAVKHCMKDSRDMRSEVDAYKYSFLRTPVMFNGRFILVFIERNQLRILSGSSTFCLKEEKQDQGRI